MEHLMDISAEASTRDNVKMLIYAPLTDLEMMSFTF